MQIFKKKIDKFKIFYGNILFTCGTAHCTLVIYIIKCNFNTTDYASYKMDTA